MMRMMTARAAAFVLALGGSALAGSSPAFAVPHGTRVVHPGQSIQAAVDAASPGDKIVVLPGTYHEAICVTTDGIRLQGAHAVIRPPAQAPQTPCSFGPEGQAIGIALFGQFNLDTGEVIDPISDVKVSGFRVENFAEFGIGMIGGEDVDIVGNTAVDNGEYGIVRFNSTGGTLKNNRATGSGEAGLYLGDSPQARATIVGNTAWDNGLFGIFVRDASHGSVTGNTSFGNCVGIFVLSTTPVPARDWTVRNNRVHDNTKACPPSEEAPPLSGIGIGLAGAHDTKVLHNTVTGNRPTGPSLVTGGIAVFSTVPLGGSDPVDNLVESNRLRDNEPDLFYDGTGSGNVFLNNRCDTSVPTGLC